MLAAGATLLATALAQSGESSATAKIRLGGTFRVAYWEVFDSIDPALAAYETSWALLHATCAKLLNYPDRPLPLGGRAVPEVAARYPVVSKDGRRYTFTLRRSFRFSNGAKLDARSFRDQINRLLRLDSDGAFYAQDIVGAKDVMAGKATAASGITARGNTLVIRLERRVPDFSARLPMPLFCAVPPGLPADPEGVGAHHSAGPYYVSQYQSGRRVVLQRNRFYRGKRPHRVDRIIADLGLTQSEGVARIARGAADWGHFSVPDRARELARRYGLNRRVFTRPWLAEIVFPLNTRRGIFANNARLRRAVNFAVDRAALVQTSGGRLSARPNDQYLPVSSPGFVNVRVYPLTRPNLRRARALARGRIRGRKAQLYTCSDLPICIPQAQVVKNSLAKIGLEVEISSFPRSTLYDKLGTRGEPWDIAWLGWAVAYYDPYDFLNDIFAAVPFFDSVKWNRRLDRAARLSGPARYRAYSDLDADLARQAAPMIAGVNATMLTFVSRRVDPRCIVLRPQLDLAAACLK